MNGNPLPPKKEVALALLERGSVHVHLDPRATGVVVPAWFKRQPQLVLQVGLNMPVPIPDLRVDEDGMSCTLSFNRSPFFCIVPWSSVYAMVGDDGRGMVWPEDVPPEVALQGRARDAETAKKAPAARPLAVVKSPGEPAQQRPAQKATRGARTARVEATAAAKEKKPRAKKPRVESATAPAGSKAGKRSEGGNGQGVLIPIPAAASKPARPRPQPAPERASAAQTAPRERPPAEVTTGNKQTPVPAAAPSPAQTAPAPGKPKPGKPRREIPPYLRVVK